MLGKQVIKTGYQLPVDDTVLVLRLHLDHLSVGALHILFKVGQHIGDALVNLTGAIHLLCSANDLESSNLVTSVV